MGFWDSISTFVQGITGVESEHTRQMKWLLQQANAWRYPNASDYCKEIARRKNYVDGDMEADALVLLKQEFPKLWRDMQDQMVLYNPAEYIVDKKSQVFNGRGARFYLVDEKTGKEIDEGHEAAKDFDYLLKASNFLSAGRDINRAVTAARECAGKPWWDDDHVEVSCYWPDKAHVAVNPDRPWDPYSAFAVLFEQTGDGGIGGEPRFEVWGARDLTQADERDDLGKRIFHPSLHYIATMAESMAVNEADANPFKHWRTGAPMMPFTWFRSYRGNVYAQKGGDSLVKLTRAINLDLTWLRHNLHWQMTPVPVFETPAGDVEAAKQLKGVFLNSPRHALNLPKGVSLSFVSPNANPVPFTSTYEMLIQYMALFQGLSPKHLDIRGGLPASGIALRIELDGLVRHNAMMTEILRPQVLDLIERMIVVWNTYAPHVRGRKFKAIPGGLRPAWDAGQFDTGPTDYIEIGARMGAECAVGVSSYADWAKAVHGITTDREAADLVRSNVEFNREIDDLLRIAPPEPTAADDEADKLPAEGDDQPQAKPAEGEQGGGVEGANADKLVANVYQIVKAIDTGAATAVDLRMALYPNETRDQAEAQVAANLEYNKETAAMLAEIRAIEEGTGGAPTTEQLKGVVPGQQPTRDQLDAEAELQKMIDE